MGISQSCVIGIIIAIIGIVLRFYPPKNINNIMGYKTPFSMKNKNTWYEANRFCGGLLIFIGIIFISASVCFYYMNLPQNLSMLILCILFIVSIVSTEIHLRKLFDKIGLDFFRQAGIVLDIYDLIMYKKE